MQWVSVYRIFSILHMPLEKKEGGRDINLLDNLAYVNVV